MQFKETSVEMKQTGDQVTIERLCRWPLWRGEIYLEISATTTFEAGDFANGRFHGEGGAETKTAAKATPGR